MLKYLILSILIANSVWGAKLTLDERRKKILSIVDEELSEVSRLAKQQDYKSPDTLLRLSELNLEKARLWREAENEQYLNIPVEERRNLNKKDYFKNSNKFFDAANDSGLVVVKRFPKYKGIGEVYYILAYNYKELGNNDLAQKYFKLASKDAPKDSKVGLKSKLALADYYYNAGKFKEAIPLYEASVNKMTEEKWWTKDAFNLAWSYYRVKNYDRAINLMKEVHRKSGGKYVDMRNMVERDIGIFYIDAGRMNEAISFYEGLGINYTEQFVKIASSIVTQGRFAQAETLLKQAAKNEKNRDKRVEILIAQLNLFDKYNKVSEHLEVCKELVGLHLKEPLNSDDYNKLVYHVNKKAAELQKATASDIYKNVPKVQKQKSQEAIAYFELSGQLSPGQKAEKIFFQGETAYAARNYGKAIGLYITAFDAARANNDKKIMNQSLEGMLSSLGQKGLSPKIAERNYVPVYTRYLSFDSKSERANSIYVKLFNAQFDAKDIAGAEKTMADFAKNFPKDYKTQEGMLAKIMEEHRKSKNYAAVKSYVTRINDGEFRISKKYADALRSLMTKIQIEGVQQSLQKGDKAVALKGYHQIYESGESTPKAKVNAAYNLSALYYEMGNSDKSYEWSVIAIRDMEVADVNKFADSFLSIASGLFLRQEFNRSADLSYRMVAKLCKENSSNKVIAYKNAAFIALANNDINKALEVRDFGKQCAIADAAIAEVSFEILKDLAKARRWESYEKLIAELETNSKNYPQLIKPYEDLRKEYLGIGNNEEARQVAEKQNRFYQLAKSQKLDIPVEALDLMAEKMLTGVQDKKQRLDQIRLQFPEAEFNSAVKMKLQLLDQMTSDVNSIQKVGSGKGIVEAYKYVIESYESFGNELKNFAPEGKSPEYVASFKKAMAEVHGPILANARKQRSEVKKLINDNKILTFSNYAVLYSEIESNKRFLTEKEAVLMERGGRQ
ncbi:tetratricopeptide repeat protein [Peredibacter sp. HCB2-198]|uniref:tetratricopeptide repeat protein n=1 Tax=Peredibacter sp. HCB2-198 TaxID=3383025 RepID=UPI0038B5A834